MTEYVRVPREPTEAMLVNGREALLPLIRLDSYGPLIGLWRDMLAASPQGEDRWIKHDGGPNPVPGKTVECKLAGTSFPMAALPSECLNWAADLRFGGSIIAYRVTEGVKP